MNEMVDEVWYLTSYPDLEGTELSPQSHYELYGRQEGRLPKPPGGHIEADRSLLIAGYFKVLFDAEWYLSEHPDLTTSELSPSDHYILYGEKEGRRPNKWFDPVWYKQKYKDVSSPDISPLMHYIEFGASELRSTSAEFDAVYYSSLFKNASPNPLAHFMLFGRKIGASPIKPVPLADCLPSVAQKSTSIMHRGVTVIIPIYKGLDETRDCIEGLLSDPQFERYKVICIEDQSPEPELAAYLQSLDRRIDVRVNEVNLGFVKTVNLGMELAGRDDVILLNSDTITPSNWVSRLQAHAYSGKFVASVCATSNNATVCSYPSMGGNKMPFGLSIQEVDTAFEQANHGRNVEVPTTVGFCMYIRRDALDVIGYFDAATFGRGYGEEVDFCRRAQERGYVNLQAWDLFVFHAGEVSFGKLSSSRVAGEQALLLKYPGFLRDVNNFVSLDPGAGFRLAATLSIFQRSSKLTVLMISHELGGGVDHQINLISSAEKSRINVLLLQPGKRGYALRFPQEPSHPAFEFGREHLSFVGSLLSDVKLDAVHVHHWIGHKTNLFLLLALLKATRFCLTVHDYFSVCPQVNFTQSPGGYYCGEPTAPVCNRCMSARGEKRNEDIIVWRLRSAALLAAADRVFFPSDDTKLRIDRYFSPHPGGITLPHEPEVEEWIVENHFKGRRGKLRVAVLGNVSAHKGAWIVEKLARRLDESDVELIVIGTFTSLATAEDGGGCVRVTGAYSPPELHRIIEQVNPHLIWFPATWPETYSFTLSEAISFKLPILAPQLGAFTSRLIGRPLTWLVPNDLTVGEVIGKLEEIAEVLRTSESTILAPKEVTSSNSSFTADAYTSDTSFMADSGKSLPAVLRRKKPVIAIVPERNSDGGASPCAYIRTILPLERLKASLGFELVVCGPEGLSYVKPHHIVTQRHAFTSPDIAGAVLRLAKGGKIGLTYDLDDDLLTVREDHPEYATLMTGKRCVEMFCNDATNVTVSTVKLATKLQAFRDVVVVPNALDDELWQKPRIQEKFGEAPVRLLYMGTSTHSADFALVAPSLERVKQRFGGRIEIEIVGVTRGEIPSFVRRVGPPERTLSSYPGFVDWISKQNRWDIGLAPLVDNDFNQSKSNIKTIDYAAMGLCSLASNMSVYTDSIASSGGGYLVDNEASVWEEVIEYLVLSSSHRAELQRAAYEAYMESHSLSAQSDWRADAFGEILRL